MEDHNIIMSAYYASLEEEHQKEMLNSANVLSTIEPLVSPKYFKAINKFLEDEENGIWGDLKIVDKTIGQWQGEPQNKVSDNYWNELRGMYVNQSCGISGDDYSGTLEIDLPNGKFLRCSFSL